MVSIKNGKVIAILFLFALQNVFAANLYVSRPGGFGAYNTIMSAIKDAKPGDSVIIMDDGVYEEQVTIDSTKGGLVLTHDRNSSSKKPTIKWQDRVNVGPKTWDEAQIESKITFDQNGALQIKRVRGVVVDGIVIDGGGAYVFGYDAIWGGSGQRHPLQHGNAAITVWVAGGITIRNCDIQNAFFGINVKDRNEGGINANPNPADLEKKRIVALSGFGKTGNHLFENNRVHNNSFGMFFESTWDLASVIRFNLFYENHHYSNQFAYTVKKLTNAGEHLPGGAFLFKDHQFSPLAVYNNTFWHNFLIFVGNWRPGSHYLIFNNIYAQPNIYWGLDPNFQNPFHACDQTFAFRTFNCVYACQTEAPKSQIVEVQEFDQAIMKMVKDTVITYQPRIMNNMGDVQAIDLTVPLQLSDRVVQKTVSSAKVEGNLIVNTTGGAYPVSANIRWLETKFKSTDPSSSVFLVPDWDDSLVNQFILDQGWPEGGVRDADGSIADLGAIPFSGQPKTVVTITQTAPVIIDSKFPTQASVSFNVSLTSGSFNNPVIKYIRWITPLDTTDKFGNGRPIIPASNIHTIPVTNQAVNVGANALTFSIPSHDTTKLYGFFELILEGTDSDGKKVASSVGFLSYRRLEYMFDVLVLSADLSDTLTEVTVGQPYVLRIRPLKIGNRNQAFTSKIDTVDVSLRSPFTLWTPQNDTFRIVGGIPEGVGRKDGQIMFTKVPEGGYDAINVSGIFSNTSQGNKLAIYGTSADIKILPGPPEKILFQDPPSKGLAVVDPGQLYNVRIQVYDKYDNKVKQVTAVKLESKEPLVGDVEPPSQVNSDTNGVAILRVKVTDGEMNDTFPIIGTLLLNNSTDNAKMIVGRARNRLYIYYSDTASYNPDVIIPVTTCTGVLVPVKIRASTDGFDTVTTINNTIGIAFDNPALVAYRSESDTTPVTSVTMINGFVTIWIQLKSGSTRNASIIVTNLTSEVRLYGATRNGINFVTCVNNIKTAEYRAENGFGKVDRLDLFYPENIDATEIPDSLQLFWPTAVDNRKIVPRSAMTLDSADSTHVIVTLPDPFPKDITSSTTLQLGTSYWKNPLVNENQVFQFQIKDKVGPLIKSAKLIERLNAGGADTLIIAFTEYINSGLIKGNSFQILKAGGITLRVDSVQQILINEVKVIIANQGETQSPKAGDSLKIFVGTDGKSLVIDANGNFAHPDNRPVAITIQEIPPSVTDASYEDRNGDGTVDYVTMNFTKKVKISNEKYRIVFRTTISSDTIRSDKASYPVSATNVIDSTTVILNLSNGGLPVTAKNFTDGAMDIYIFDTMFTGAIIGNAKDKAAPVLIDSVKYIQGRAQEDGTLMADSLDVTFSEAINDAQLISGTPFQFLQTTSNTTYYITLQGFSNSGKRLRFIVIPASKEMLTTNVKNANTGDSVRIYVNNGVSSFSDIAGNIQKVEANRNVKMVVIVQPVALVIKLGPNPFVPDGKNSMSIIVAPQKTPRKQDVTVQATITILDNMGNLIFTQEGKNPNGSEVLKISWNGTNTKGRLVGTGTYLVYIKTVDLLKVKSEETIVRKLAVKRTKANN